MKKLLLFASALTGFAFMAQAEEATTIKTTTVQYQVPTCTNCRTTTEVRTVYPEVKPEPVCTTCAAQPVYVPEEPKPAKSCDKDNHEFGIRNPLFVLKEGQFMARQTASVFKEPKHKSGTGDIAENRANSLRTLLKYGITNRWSVFAGGGTEYVSPKKKSFTEAEWTRPARFGGGYHSHTYYAEGGTEYHLIDLCHFDAIVGLKGEWHRYETQDRDGSKKIGYNGYSISPTAKIGMPIGWFTPFIEAAYIWDNTHMREADAIEKSWDRSHGYYINPGVYFQPSKWFGMSFDYQKWERSKVKPQWNVRADFYPYKNVSLSLQLNARNPTKDPMQMYGAAADFGIVF